MKTAIRVLLLSSLILHPSSLLAYNNLSVERRTVRVGEIVVITVSLEDDFVDIESIDLPVQNLTISGPPSVASESALINFTAVRRKVFRFRARADRPGAAIVGPLVLNAGAQRDTLAAIAIEVVPDRAASSNDPQVILAELLATGREPMFVVAELEKSAAYVGEQVVVTWYLYNGSAVQQWQIGAIPKLDDFWVEELDVRSTRPSQVFVGETSLQRMPVRRVALYPLRAGRLEVGPMEIEAAIMRRMSRGPFAMFEGNLIELAFASAPVALSASALPPGAPVSAVGDLMMRCLPPQQNNGGPVVIDAVVSGHGNLRSAQPPSFASPPAGEVQRIERGVTVQRTADSAVMTRRWQFQIFPSQRGTLAIPELRMPVFSPAASARQMLQCGASTLEVTAAERPPLAPPAASANQRAASSFWLRAPYMIATAIAIVFFVFVFPWWRRRSRLDRTIRAMIAGGDPAIVRENVHASLEERGIDPASLLRDGTERGDAYRALRSLLDALERGRIDVSDPNREMRRRIRELLLA
ncbi:MAG TPA: BatD family protein [Thermoanaerobaculia bacterium]